MLAVLPACTIVPTADVAAVKLEKQGTEGARVVAIVRLENATTTPMPMVGVNYRLVVEGAEPFELDDQPFRTVPTSVPDKDGALLKGIQELKLPAGIPSRVSLAGKKYVLDGELTFEPDTDWRRLKTELGVPLPTRFFHAEGVLAATPPAVPSSMPVKAP